LAVGSKTPVNPDQRKLAPISVATLFSMPADLQLNPVDPKQIL